MIITNKDSLLQALEQGYTLTIDNSGNIKTENRLSSSFRKFADLFRSAKTIKVRQQCLQIAMANIVNSDSIVNAGPRNIQEPLHSTSRTLEEIAATSQEILCSAMITYILEKKFGTENPQVQKSISEYIQKEWAEDNSTVPISYPAVNSFISSRLVGIYVTKILYNKPEPIRKGVISFLTSSWEKENSGSQPKQESIEQYVTQEIDHWQRTDPLGLTIANLAYGYTIDSEALTEHMQFFKQGILEAIDETWKEDKLTNYSDDGIFNLFTVDAPRDRPSIQGERVFLQSDLPNAKDIYVKMIKEEFPEFSMAAIVTTIMTQKSLPNLSCMVSGIKTYCPLNPYIPNNKDDNDMVPDVVPLIENSDSIQPRMTLTHNNEEIIIHCNYGIKLCCPILDLQQTVGNVQVDIVIPKGQFPLPISNIPNIQVKNMQVNRPVGFVA
ncbi:hypothetical protein BW722_00175 [Lawsonia intracellularis]|uniref:hypothetical protein n=1 Tax=Lawsonia intracellularis TaxID=29546 RepID=UPI0009774C80|nr:hypothetical protein [Lawsonia intracellularis]OMQ06092.1 hypothetical protein BW722_00175 [Lawsonia intracellularis]